MAAFGRWLLELDRPVPARTEDEIAAEVERNYTWNFTVNLLDGVWFWLGSSFISSATILPLFLSKVTTNPLWFGILAVIAQAGWFLPQLFTANLMERLARKKPVVINAGFFLERVPIWVIFAAALAAYRSPAWALALILLGYAWHSLGAGAVAVSWQDLIARCFPVNRRGRFFGITAFLGAGMGALGAALSSWLLKRHPFPTSFVYIFVGAAISITLSWLWLALTREPVQASSVPRRGNLEYLGSLPEIVRRDVNYRRFLTARILMAFGWMGSGFVTVAAVRQWTVPDSTVGFYTLAQLAGQTAGNLFFGFLADRLGHKLSLEVGMAAGCTAFALAWLAPNPAWYYAVFALMGISAASSIVSGILIIMEFSGAARRPTYMGIANTAVGLAGIVAPLLGTALTGIGFGWLFAASAGFNLAAFALFRWWVREPRRTS